MARLMGTGLRSLRQSHLLRSPVIATSRRPALLKPSECLLKYGGFWHVRQYGESAAVEEVTDVSRKPELSSDNIETREDLKAQILEENVGEKHQPVDNSVVVDKGRTPEQKKVVNAKGSFDTERHPSGDRKLPVQTSKVDKISRTLSDILLSTKADPGGRKGSAVHSQHAQKPLKVANLASGHSKLQHESFKARQPSVPQSKPSTGVNEEDDFSDLDYPQERQQSRVNSTSSGSTGSAAGSSLNFHFLADALERDSSMTSVPPKSAPITRKKVVSSNMQNMNNQQVKINFDFLKESTSGGPSSSKAETNNLPSRREEPLGFSMKNEAAVPSKEDSGYSVSIENLPNEISVVRVKEALSRHGVIIGSFRKPGNGFSACHIEFQTSEAKENALAERWLFLDGQQFPINRLDRPMTTVVRISHVSPETTDNRVLSICEKCGKVDNLKKRERGIFDIYFKVKELPNMARILDGLNEVTVNQSRWRAHPAPLVHPDTKNSILLTKEGLGWYNDQVNCVLDRMNVAVSRYSINVEDLKELHSIGK